MKVTREPLFILCTFYFYSLFPVLYGTDYDSDYEVDGNAYELKPPPSSGSLTGVVYYYSCKEDIVR